MVEKVWGLKHVVNLHIRSDFASRNRIKDGLTKKKTTNLNTIKHDASRDVTGKNKIESVSGDDFVFNFDF
jgi:hypothetical protein